MVTVKINGPQASGKTLLANMIESAAARGDWIKKPNPVVRVLDPSKTPYSNRELAQKSALVDGVDILVLVDQ